MKYIYTLVCREALRQFDSLSADMEGMNLINVKNHYFRVSFVLFPVNLLSKKRGAMRRGTSKPRSLKVRQYADSLIYLNY